MHLLQGNMYGVHGPLGYNHSDAATSGQQRQGRPKTGAGDGNLGREAGRQGGREAGRQGGREAGRQAGRQGGRQGGREAGR
jgi:hypothetical protein